MVSILKGCAYTGGIRCYEDQLGMLPDFTENGLLPEGIHRATFEEFEKRFVYFDVSDRRFRLFDRLRILYQEARRSGIVKRFLVGGSFVTSKAEPNDFDCILVLDSKIRGEDLRPLEYNIASEHMARRMFRGDVFPVVENSMDFHKFMTLLEVTRSGERVGIVEIEI
jgi:hypothetical protein